jgi:sulfur carrier protein
MSITIRLNGHEHPLDADISVTQLIVSLDLDPQRRGLAVAMNGALVPRRAWPETMVIAGAEVEIVQPLQGG